MFLLKDSLRQLLRTPVKSFFFLLLMTLSTAFLAIGVYLNLLTRESQNQLEETFITIGTVEQIPKSVETVSYYDGTEEKYTSYHHSVYDGFVADSALDFPDTNYILHPEQRPYYGAYSDSYQFPDNLFSANWCLIIEAETREDCVPSAPVRLYIKRVLNGKAVVGDWLWFCDPGEENPELMKAGTTYILSIDLSSSFGEKVVYTPGINTYSSQFDHAGNRLLDPNSQPSKNWDVVTDGYYETPQGKRWAELILAIKKWEKTIPVVPTNGTQLLMDFYSGEANIIEGRDITPEEYAWGEKVCLIQQDFAERNTLNPGDKLRLPLYFADYHSSAGFIFPLGGGGLITFGLLNAEGKAYSIFEDSEYTVVGVYHVIPNTSTSSHFATAKNQVILPSASVKASDENNIPAFGPMKGYNASFQIPNGSIPAFQKAWAQTGNTDLEFQFYDKGYTQVKEGLDQSRFLAWMLLSIGATTTILTMVFFTHLLISKSQKRIAIARSLGISKKKYSGSLLFGSMILSGSGTVIGTIFGNFFSVKLMEHMISTGEKSLFSLSYSSWVNSADKVATATSGYSSIGLSSFVFFTLAVLMVSAGISLIGIRKSLKAEPLALLGNRKE